MNKFLLTVKEASEVLGLPKSTIRWLYLNEKDFPFVKIRQKYYIKIELAKVWLIKSYQGCKLENKFLVQAKDAVEILGLSYARIRDLYLYEDGFPFVKIGSRYYIQPDMAKLWLTESRSIA